MASLPALPALPGLISLSTPAASTLRNTANFLITRPTRPLLSYFVRSTSSTAYSSIRNLHNLHNSICTRTCMPPNASPARHLSTNPDNMSFLYHPLYNEEASFAPLFRLLDDFDSYTRQASPRAGHRVRNFTPRFDMRETQTSFELHGELPGIDRENIAIDFTDPQTMVIKGKVERHYEAGTPPGGLVSGPDAPGVITEAGEGSPKPCQVTVEDAGETGQVEETQGTKKEAAVKEDRSKYWYSERSIGEFTRTFGFHCVVDQESVTASLQDGILNVSVPKAKAKKSAARRITVN